MKSINCRVSKQKTALLKAGYDQVNDRITVIKKALQSVQEAANQETKSSAGDKYETGRAMMHLEKEKLSGQMAEALKMKQALDVINPEKTWERAELGALVQTAQASYFLSVSLGKLEVAGQTVFAISPASPIGRQLLGKKVGDTIQFGGKIMEITEVG